MKTELIVTILLAFVGWAWGLYQFVQKRSWQKKDRLSDRRYEAYNRFMNKLDELNESMRTNPNLIFGDAESFLKVICGGSKDEINDALINYSQSLIDMVKGTIEPLLIIKQEVNTLTLIASEELMVKLNSLKEMVTDLNNEMQNCLSIVSAKDPNSFKIFKTLGHDKRWLEYKWLYEEIVQLMRKEMDVK